MPDTAKRADWTYRIAMAAMTAGIAWGVNWIGDKVDTLSGLPGQVRQLGSDQALLKASVEDVKKAQEDAKKAQDEMRQTQSGFATGAEVGTLRSDIDKLTGRVDTMETTVNSLVKPAPRR
ncbi:hypothetical protein [Inquilinus sp.]|jgi:hypothetical protein|uniref:hypothetical protein n=1 Tax=Inquilinus sp. TaxID=1932117 RepID=UPI00378407A3